MTSTIHADKIMNSSGDQDSGVDLLVNDQVKLKTANTDRVTVTDASTAIGNRVTCLLGDGVATDNWAMDVRNDEQTDNQSWGLRVSAGSTYTDRALDVLDHAQANSLLRVQGDGIVKRPQTPLLFVTKTGTEQIVSSSGSDVVIDNLTGSYYNSYPVANNTSSWWDSSTSKFTAPTGSGTTYHYVSLTSLVGVTIPSASGVNWGFIGIRHSGTATQNLIYRAYFEAYSSEQHDGNMKFHTMSAQGVVKMVAGNYLQPVGNGTSGVNIRFHSGTYTNFSIMQIA